MKSSFGWTLLSREALKRAETQLREEEEGVRDEVGFLAIHQAYADRFFPGTSVLQTRLRYALFVPWIYERLARAPDRRRFNQLLEREEVLLAGRLKFAEPNQDGIIGGRSYPKPTTQPASLASWTALGVWRILRPRADGEYPGRAAVHRHLSGGPRAAQGHDDDRGQLEETESVFVTLPQPPPEWNQTGEALTFDLSQAEARFLRKLLLAVRRPGASDAPSLLSRLVERSGKHLGPQPWGASVRDLADPADAAALSRAGQAAALAAIGRGVYAALVEDICEREDGRAMPRTHRAHLRTVIDEFRSEGLSLEIPSMVGDAPSRLNDGILKVLTSTQEWLRSSKRDFMDLRDVYTEAELRRKGRRARLVPTLGGRARRAEWLPEKHTLAEPLHYRWPKVKRLLRDLGEAGE